MALSVTAGGEFKTYLSVYTKIDWQKVLIRQDIKTLILVACRPMLAQHRALSLEGYKTQKWWKTVKSAKASPQKNVIQFF